MIKISHGRKGKAEYIPFQGTREEALIFERDLRGLTDRSDPGFSDHLPDFLIAYRNRVRPNTYKSMMASLKHLQPFFSGLKMRYITPAMIEKYKAHRLDQGVKKRTINIELSALSSYITWMNENLGTKFEKPRPFSSKETRAPSPVVLTTDELAALISQLTGQARTIVSLMAMCGLRQDEVFSLTVGQVDIDGRLLRIYGKGGKWRATPLPEPLVDDMLARCDGRVVDDLVFTSTRTGGRVTDIRKSLTKAAARAGIHKHVTPHLLRHSFATALVNSGENLRIIQEIMGHADIQTTQIYTHIAAQSKRAAVDKLVAMVATVKSDK